MSTKPVANRTEQTRERILEAGFACVRDRGIRRLVMETVAKEAGVSRAALYRYFPNKQALVDELLETNARRMRRELNQLLVDKVTLAEKVGAAARFGHFPPRDLMLLGLSESDPESLALLLTSDSHAFLERATRFWEPHVEEAQRRNEIARQLDCRQASEWIARSFFNLATLPAVTFDGSDPAQFERYAVTYVLGGLCGR